MEAKAKEIEMKIRSRFSLPPLSPQTIKIAINPSNIQQNQIDKK
jgi:hypothetical protein